jgi:uncharacterized membrane-anchored protein YhcB (DUF1043 family)
MAEQTKKDSSLTTGLAIGAAIGAVAVALTDKKNQKKVKNAFETAKKWAEEKSNEVRTSAEDVIEKAQEDVDQYKKEAVTDDDTASHRHFN